MFLEQRELLKPEEVARLVALSREIRFIEGRASNPANTSKVNLQADLADNQTGEAARIVLNALTRSRSFRDFAMPKKIAPPLLSRYEPGMKYGPHADAPFMAVPVEGGMMQLRSDLSCTIFLNDPHSYEGGELVLHAGTHPVVIKGLPGEGFFYPSTFLHEVRPVTAGQRLVSITFIESVVPDERLRNTLFELKDIMSLEALKMDRINWVRMDVALSNLTRLWSQS